MKTTLIYTLDNVSVRGESLTFGLDNQGQIWVDLFKENPVLPTEPFEIQEKTHQMVRVELLACYLTPTEWVKLYDDHLVHLRARATTVLGTYVKDEQELYANFTAATSGLFEAGQAYYQRLVIEQFTGDTMGGDLPEGSKEHIDDLSHKVVAPDGTQYISVPTLMTLMGFEDAPEIVPLSETRKIPMDDEYLNSEGFDNKDAYWFVEMEGLVDFIESYACDVAYALHRYDTLLNIIPN